MYNFMRNAYGVSIGYTYPRGDRIFGYRMNGMSVGYYYPNFNVTYTPDGRRFGSGNLLAVLIFDACG
jgi:hypothetical protein